MACVLFCVHTLSHNSHTSLLQDSLNLRGAVLRWLHIHWRDCYIFKACVLCRYTVSQLSHFLAARFPHSTWRKIYYTVHPLTWCMYSATLIFYVTVARLWQVICAFLCVPPASALINVTDSQHCYLRQRVVQLPFTKSSASSPAHILRSACGDPGSSITSTKQLIINAWYKITLKKQMQGKTRKEKCATLSWKEEKTFGKNCPAYCRKRRENIKKRNALPIVEKEAKNII